MNDVDEEWWAEQDRRMRLLEKLRKAFIYLAGMALCAAFLFVLLFVLFQCRNTLNSKAISLIMDSHLINQLHYLLCRLFRSVENIVHDFIPL